MAKVDRLSPSKITTYKGCPLAYYLKYEEHVHVPENIRLAFGKEVHYLLDQFYKKDFKSPDSFAKFFSWRWFSHLEGNFLRGKQKREMEPREFFYGIDKETGEKKSLIIGSHVDIGPFNPDNEEDSKTVAGIIFGYWRIGQNIMKMFYQRHKNKPKPLETEKRFGFKKDEVIELGGHELLGVFDRIDCVDGEWYITDYKTNKHNPKDDAFTFHRNVQFTLYSYVFRQLFGELEQSILFYHLRSGEILKTHRSQQDFDYLRTVLDDVTEGIENEKFLPFYGFHCNFCDYKSACEQESEYYGGPGIVTPEGKIIGAEEFKQWYSVDSEIPPEIEDMVLETT